MGGWFTDGPTRRHRRRGWRLGRHSRASWHAAAKRADFVPWTVVEPEPDDVWAGGFGTGPRATRSLDVMHMVEGDEVEVATEFVDDAHWFRAMADPINLFWRVIHHADVLPYGPGVDSWEAFPVTITADAESRTISVDGTPQTFDGVRVGDRLWAGTAVVDKRMVTVVIQGTTSVHAIEKLRNFDGLSELPPDAR